METMTMESRPARPAPNEHTAHEAPGSPPRRARTRTILIVALIVFGIFAAFLVVGLIYRSRHGRQLAATASQVAQAPPQAFVVHPVASVAADWSLPGNTQAISDSIIYARVSGYLIKRYVDIGQEVKAGQLLAEIQSPELDQQLSQAKANLQQAQKQLELQKANMELARSTMDRYKGADKEQAVAKLLVDQTAAAFVTSQASVAAAEATVSANEANVRQFAAMTAFERVVAPFDGMITQRNVDVGALITAGSPTNNTSVAPTSVTGAATGLFEVSQIDTLRVFVNIPQVFALNVKPGMAAQVTVRGQLTAPVAAAVARTANALDPGTRTLLTEVDIPNSTHAMLPGEFVYVAFKLNPSGRRWILPATALIFDSQGTQVMLVEPGGKLHVQKVTVGRDFGDTIEIQAGLTGSETVVKQPDVSLKDGQTVTPVESPAPPPQGE